jgi:hypothetical protein
MHVVLLIASCTVGCINSTDRHQCTTSHRSHRHSVARKFDTDRNRIRGHFFPIPGVIKDRLRALATVMDASDEAKAGRPTTVSIRIKGKARAFRTGREFHTRAFPYISIGTVGVFSGPRETTRGHRPVYRLGIVSILGNRWERWVVCARGEPRTSSLFSSSIE